MNERACVVQTNSKPMYASKTISSKPNKQIKNSRLFFYSYTFFSFQNLGINRLQPGTRLKTMLASPVAALRTCVIFFCLDQLM